MKTALLVDDDPTFRFLGKTLLGMVGVPAEDIQVASNGQQAIDLLERYISENRSLPQVILLDINMPILNGFGFIEAFRKLAHPDLQKVEIVMVSSSLDIRDVQRAFDLGVTKFLTKPLTEEALADILIVQRVC